MSEPTTCDQCSQSLGSKYYSDVPGKGNLCLECHKVWYEHRMKIGDYDAINTPVYHWDQVRTKEELEEHIAEQGPVPPENRLDREAYLKHFDELPADILPDMFADMHEDLVKVIAQRDHTVEALKQIQCEVDRLDCVGSCRLDTGVCLDIDGLPVEDYCARCAIIHWATKGVV